MIKIKKRTLTLIVVISILIGSFIPLGITIFSHRSLNPFDTDYSHMKYMTEKYGKTEVIMEYISKNYYKDNVDENNLVDFMNKGLVYGLGDEYSQYMTEKEYENLKNSLSSSFCGIGVSISGNANTHYKIDLLVKDGPAEKVGIKVGDLIYEVDGKKADENIIVKLRGKEGTKLSLKVLRGNEFKTFTLIREEIKNETVYVSEKDDVSIIKITSFRENTYKDFMEALKKIENSSNTKGVVIDLRNNLGGILTQGTKVADELLPKGKICTLKNEHGKEEVYKSDSDKINLPFVLLVNKYTASASEIVTAAVKDYGTGTIIGETTYGKGVAQYMRQFTDGDALKLTEMEYFSPKGKTVNKKGVKPNILIKNSDKQLEKAIRELS